MKKIALILLLLLSLRISGTSQTIEREGRRLNILFVISDDQSFAHTSIEGSTFVNTPAFDKVASEGIYFKNCFAGSPGCAPSRSAIITGRHHWQNEQSGQHAAPWLNKYVPFVDLLSTNGYATGRTGKGISPFQYARNEQDSAWRETDAAGIAHSTIRYEAGTPEDVRPSKKVSNLNYFENFRYFMENIKGEDPFFFWFGATEPHRDYELDSWKRTDKKLTDVTVPGFFPDNDIIKGDMLDYAVEIEWFDNHLNQMLKYLEEIGELDNTIIIVTSDNGMPFPRAKANSYEFGIHVPLAIRYPKDFPGGRVVKDLVGFSDLAPTILELTGTSSVGMMPITGKSFVDILESKRGDVVDKSRKYAFSGRERHSSSRYLNWGYPQRAIRSQDFLLVWNMKADRWPAGAPQRIKPDTDNELLPIYGVDEEGVYHPGWAFTDIDESPTKSYLIENRQEDGVDLYFGLAHDKRPEYELFDIRSDPDNLNNLIGNKSFQKVEEELKKALLEELVKTADPRVVDEDKEVFDSYLRYSPMREFPAPKSEN